MKNIFKQSFIALAVIFSFASCDNIDLDGFEPDVETGWIEFGATSDQVSRTDGAYTIPVEFNVPVHLQNTQVSYTVEVVSGNAPGADVGEKTVTVLAETRDVQIDYEIDPTILSSYVLKFTITSTTNPKVIVGLEGDNPIEFELEVCSNLLPLAYTGQAFIGTSLINDFDVILTPTDDCTTWNMNSAWGNNFVAEATGSPAFLDQFIYESDLILDESDMSVTIVGTGADAGALPGSVPQDESISGNFVDLDTGVITYSLSQGLFSNPFLVEVILTPIP